MKSFVLVVLCLLFSVPIFAQSTTLSGTITDASGQAWIRGTYALTFKVSPSQPTGQYFWNGAPFSTTTTIQGQLDGSGHFSVSVPSNTSITPAGSTWVLEFCSIARGNSPCYSTSGITVTGATQSVSSIHPPAISIDLTHVAFPFVTAYSSSEITTATFAGLFWNYTLSHYFYCSAITPSGNDQSYGACTSWVELCQIGDTTCGGAGGSESFQHNGTLVGTQPTFNIIDSGTVTATMTNDTLNNRVNVSFTAAGGGTGCTLPSINTAVLSEHPAGTCYDSLHWTWDDGTSKQNMLLGDGTNTNGADSRPIQSLLFTTGSNNSSFGNTVFNQGHNNTVGEATSPLDYAFVSGLSNTACGDGTEGTPGCSLLFVWGQGNDIAGARNFAMGQNNVAFTAAPPGSAIQPVDNIALGVNNQFQFSGTGSPTFLNNSRLIGLNNIVSVIGSQAEAKDIHFIGTGNSATSTGGGGTTTDVEDVYTLGENNQYASTTNALVSKIYTLGEANSVQLTGLNHAAVDIAHVGFTNSAAVTGSFTLSKSTTLGDSNTVEATTATTTDAMAIGLNNTVRDCVSCIAIGESVTNTTSHSINIGATTVNITGTTNINGTPLGGGSLTSPNGYAVIGGLILQWARGTAVTTDNTQTITFPIAFPNSCLSVVTTNLNVSGTNVTKDWGVLSFNTTGVSVQLQRRGDEGSFTAQPIVWAVGF